MTTKHWRMAEKDKVTKRRLGECTVIQPNHPRITKLTIKTLTRREAPVSWSLENHAAKNPHASVICRIYYITLPWINATHLAPSNPRVKAAKSISPQTASLPRVVWGSCSLFSWRKPVSLIDETRNNVRGRENVPLSPGVVYLALSVRSFLIWSQLDFIRPSPTSAKISSGASIRISTGRENRPNMRKVIPTLAKREMSKIEEDMNLKLKVWHIQT